MLTQLKGDFNRKVGQEVQSIAEAQGDGDDDTCISQQEMDQQWLWPIHKGIDQASLNLRLSLSPCGSCVAPRTTKVSDISFLSRRGEVSKAA
jgi:hypothetical protein